MAMIFSVKAVPMLSGHWLNLLDIPLRQQTGEFISSSILKKNEDGEKGGMDA